MKVGKKSLRMGSGEIRHFKSEKDRDEFERVAKAVKHGFKPKKKDMHPMTHRMMFS